MSLTIEYWRRLETLFGDIRRFLATIETLKNKYVQKGRTAEERAAAEQEAFPEVKTYALAEMERIRKDTDDIRLSVRNLPQLLRIAAKNAELPPERVKLVETLGKQANEKIFSDLKSFLMIFEGILRDFKRGFVPQIILDTLRTVFVKSPALERTHIESMLSKLGKAEGYIEAAVRS